MCNITSRTKLIVVSWHWSNTLGLITEFGLNPRLFCTRSSFPLQRDAKDIVLAPKMFLPGF